MIIQTITHKIIYIKNQNSKTIKNNKTSCNDLKNNIINDNSYTLNNNITANSKLQTTNNKTATINENRYTITFKNDEQISRTNSVALTVQDSTLKNFKTNSYGGAIHNTGVNSIFTNSTTFNVTKQETSSTIVAKNINYDDSLIVNGTVKNISTGIINVTINGKTYVVNVIKGKWNIAITDLTVGEYKIIVSFVGNNTHKTFINSTEVTVNTLLLTDTTNDNEILYNEHTHETDFCRRIDISPTIINLVKDNIRGTINYEER